MKLLIALLLSCVIQLSASYRASTWTFPPIQISTVGQNASNPQIDIDINGNAVAVWVESDHIISKNIPFGGVWGELNTVSGSGASSPQVAVDTNGNATAIWLENGVVKTSTQPFNGAWGSTTTLSGTGATLPNLSIDLEGNIVAIWIRNGFVESTTKLLGENWPQTPEVISEGGANFPQVETNANNVVAVWEALSGSIHTIYTNQKPLNGSWGTPVAISTPFENCIKPKIALDNSGNVVVIWFHYKSTGSSYSEVKLQATHKTFVGNWSIPENLDESGYYDPNLLVSDVGFDARGNACANWNNSYDGTTFNYIAAIKKSGKDWGETILLNIQDLYAYSLDLSVDEYGHAFTAYMTYNSNSSILNVIARKMNITSLNPGWSISSAQFSIGAYNGYPQLSVAVNNNKIYLGSLWINYDGENNVIYATTGYGFNYPPPTNLSVVQNMNNFYLFEEYYNTLSWSPSENPWTRGYLVERNGIQIEILPGNVTQFIDHNQMPNSPVTYGVSAYDDNFEQSEFAYIEFP